MGTVTIIGGKTYKVVTTSGQTLKLQLVGSTSVDATPQYINVDTRRVIPLPEYKSIEQID